MYNKYKVFNEQSHYVQQKAIIISFAQHKDSDMRRKDLIAAALALITVACSPQGPAVEDGVSRELAGYRSAQISELRYELGFRIPEDRDERVSGRETITFRLKRKAPLQLDFRPDGEAVISLTVNGKPIEADCRNEHIVLDRRCLQKGLNTLELDFLSGDRSLNRNADYLYTLFVPDRARTVFPCFDQPDLKGRYSLTLDLPAGWEAVANGAELARDESPARTRVSFRETPPLSTYLFAFTAGKWRKETRLRGNAPVSVYFRETDPAKTAQLEEVFSLIKESLDWMEAYTGIPCPFEKYDCVVVPGFQFGGMEHPGAILYNERRIFLGPSPTTAERLSRTELIAHETSHLWFGDAVTMRWFNDVWTKEVFANYFASKITSPRFPEVNVPLRDFRSFNIPAYAEDRTAGTNAIRRELPNLSSAGLIYGNIVYDKAPVVMRMLSDILGEEAFRDGIREYLQTFLYGNADWNELVAILDKRNPTDLKQWSRVWVEEKGMPTIDYALAGDTLTVRQEDPLGRGLIWPQRISWANETGETVASIWSDAQAVTQRLPAPNGVLLPDPDALSYGWFRLDSLTAKAVLKALPGLARPESRLSLLATLHENVLRGEIPPDKYIELLGGLLHTERDPLVCGAVTSYLKTLSVHGPAAGSPKLETLLREAASDLSLPDELRLTAFRALMGVFRSDESCVLLRTVFREGKGYQGLTLGERDYLTLSYELALRCPEEYGRIRDLQESRITNPDLLREYRFIYPAVHPDRAVRDSVFAALLKPGNRAVEPWAASSLAYLNHPLRQAVAIGYIYSVLEALPEVQRTGDIFFPKNWCASLLDGHDSPEAAAEVKRYLDTHPELPELLKVKLLQAADHLLRNKSD